MLCWNCTDRELWEGRNGLCLDCWDEANEPDLLKHSMYCRCRACVQFHDEIGKWLQMVEAGHVDANMRLPRNPYVGNQEVLF